MKKQLLDRATAIHTVKVAKKTINNDVVKASLNQIGAFRVKIRDANSDQFDEILTELNIWAVSPPIVNENDILELRPRLRNK